ncbi:MAG: dipeptidase, partial [Candidatus Sumerlaeota bacterium]
MGQPHFHIFDGHNDTLTKTSPGGEGEKRSFLEESQEGHLDLPRARKGGFAGGMFAIFIHEDAYQWPDCDWKAPDDIPVTEDFPMQAVHPDFARRGVISEMTKLVRIERESNGQVQIVTGLEPLRRCLAEDKLAAVIHFEGAEAIDTDMEALEVFYRTGLRSLGVTWSRHNRFGYGTPAHRMGSPEYAPGLTDAGKRLVRACNRLGIVVDVSHLNAA